MTDLLSTVDNWFLVMAVIFLGGYFLWSVQRLFASLQASIDDLKRLITDLFEHRNSHETRITAIETRCRLVCDIDRRQKD